MHKTRWNRQRSRSLIYSNPLNSSSQFLSYDQRFLNGSFTKNGPMPERSISNRYLYPYNSRYSSEYPDKYRRNTNKMYKTEPYCSNFYKSQAYSRKNQLHISQNNYTWNNSRYYDTNREISTYNTYNRYYTPDLYTYLFGMSFEAQADILSTVFVKPETHLRIFYTFSEFLLICGKILMRKYIKMTDSYENGEFCPLDTYFSACLISEKFYCETKTRKVGKYRNAKLNEFISAVQFDVQTDLSEIYKEVDILFRY